MNTYLFFSDDRRDRMKNRIHHLQGARSLDERASIVCDILNMSEEAYAAHGGAKAAPCADLAMEAVRIAAAIPGVAQRVLASQAYIDYAARHRAVLSLAA